jgi:hypothetical protein
VVVLEVLQAPGPLRLVGDDLMPARNQLTQNAAQKCALPWFQQEASEWVK